MGFSDYSEEKILNWLRGDSDMPATGNRYLALFSSDPTDANTGVEITTNIRPAGRIQALFSAPSAGSVSNSQIIDFGNSFANEIISHFGLFDQASGGNLLAHGSLNSPKSIDISDEVTWPIGALALQVT